MNGRCAARLWIEEYKPPIPKGWPWMVFFFWKFIKASGVCKPERGGKGGGFGDGSSAPVKGGTAGWWGHYSWAVTLLWVSTARVTVTGFRHRGSGWSSFGASRGRCPPTYGSNARWDGETASGKRNGQKAVGGGRGHDELACGSHLMKSRHSLLGKVA